MLSRIEAEDAYDALKYPGRKDRFAYDAYQAEIKAIELQFRFWLEAEYASGLPTILLDEIWDQAWSDGHSSGYHEVENYYEDRAEFVRKIKKALS